MPYFNNVKRTDAEVSKKFKDELKGQGVPLSCGSFSIFSKCPENGQKSDKTFGDVYKKYCQLHLPTISLSSRTVKKRRLENFVTPLLEIKIQDITTQLINEFMLFSKARHYEETPERRKFNFDKQLKDLKSVFGWWQDYDPKFYNPVRMSHFKLGILKAIPHKDRQISEEELHRFLTCLKQPYQSLAYLQLFTAGRVGEIAGIQKKNIDFTRKRLLIKEVLVWVSGKPHVKELPKNNTARLAYINSHMEEILKRRMELSPLGSPMLFTNKKGNPMTYNQIQEAYNRAWKKAGLYPKFSGSHILRYGCAQLSRKIGGSLDAAVAMTGHKSIYVPTLFM